MEIQNVTDNYLEDAIPGRGDFIFEAGYQMGTHRKEVEIGKWVYNKFGGDITLLHETNKFKKF